LKLPFQGFDRALDLLGGNERRFYRLYRGCAAFENLDGLAMPLAP
jgi:hypothetical protein